MILSHTLKMACFGLVALALAHDQCSDPERLLLVSSALNEQPAIAAQVIYPAAMAGEAAALSELSRHALRLQDPYWLNILSELGDADSLFLAATQEADLDKRRTWLVKAAELDHPGAQFELAMLVEDAAAHLRWMQASAENGYQAAIISLAKYYLARQEHQKAMLWLPKAAEVDALSALKLARLQWQLGDVEQARRYFALSADMGNRDAKKLQSVLERYSPQSLSALMALSSSPSLHLSLQSGSVFQRGAATVGRLSPNKVCDQRIQFVATSLYSMAQAIAFKQGFSRDSRIKHLPICIAQPLWLKDTALQCEANFEGSGRLGCDFSALSKHKKLPDYTHLVVFAEQGKANVNNGIMFLDQADTYSVFVHELAHFAGFVDEYRLPVELANYHCSRQKAPNLSLQANTQLTRWQSLFAAQLAKLNGTEHERAAKRMAIARVATCNNAGLQAMRPSRGITFMQYHDSNNIPQIYINLWAQQLNALKDTRPLHDNFAIVAMQNKDDESLLFWQGPPQQSANTVRLPLSEL